MLIKHLRVGVDSLHSALSGRRLCAFSMSAFRKVFAPGNGVGRKFWLLYVRLRNLEFGPLSLSRSLTQKTHAKRHLLLALRLFFPNRCSSMSCLLSLFPDWRVLAASYSQSLTLHYSRNIPSVTASHSISPLVALRNVCVQYNGCGDVFYIQCKPSQFVSPMALSALRMRTEPSIVCTHIRIEF